MLGRNILYRSVRIPRTVPANVVVQARVLSGRRFASTSSKGTAGSDGPNSMLVGAGLFGATITAGYLFGKFTESGKAKQTSVSDSKSGDKKPRKAASKATPKAVVKKADEAAKETKAARSNDAASSSPSSSSGSSATSAVASSVKSAVDSATESGKPSASTPATSDSESEQPEGDADEGQSAAFDPVTGEINWDCPCLGGMASGVCGEAFKAAFSCFVYSKEEPKGQDCIDKFRAMQDCFREHPEIYGEEAMGEDDDEDYDVVSAVEEALLPDPADR